MPGAVMAPFPLLLAHQEARTAPQLSVPLFLGTADAGGVRPPSPDRRLPARSGTTHHEAMLLPALSIVGILEGKPHGACGRGRAPPAGPAGAGRRMFGTSGRNLSGFC